MKKRYLFILFILVFLLQSIIVLSLDSSECENKEKTWEINKCYHDIAIELNDSSLCINSGQYEGNCYYKIAIKLDESSLCEKSDKFKLDCYTDFAILKEDNSFCEHTNKRTCLIETSKQTDNYEFCQYDEDPNICFELLYEDTKDKRICEFLIDKPEDCLCLDDESLKENICIKLECNEDEIAENHKCEKRCESIYEYKDGKCFLKCRYGFSSAATVYSCGRVSLQWVLFYLPPELFIFFILFSLLFLIRKLKFVNNFINYFKKEIILTGIKYIFIYLNILIILLLFERNVDVTIYGIYGSSISFPIAVLFSLVLLIFIIGILTYLFDKKIKRVRFFSESLVRGFGAAIFLQIIDRINEFTLESVSSYFYYPIHQIEYKFGLYRFWIISYYFNIFLEIVYATLIFTLIILLIRYIYSRLIKQFVIRIKNIIPKFILDSLYLGFIFMPFMVFIIKNLPSTFDIAGLLFDLGIKVTSVYARSFYVMIIYSFILGLVYNLNKCALEKLYQYCKNRKTKLRNLIK